MLWLGSSYNRSDDMKMISIEVPDMLANRFEAASDREKLIWAYRLASIVEEDAPPEEIQSIMGEIKAWQVDNGVSDNDFDTVFAELAAED